MDILFVLVGGTQIMKRAKFAALMLALCLFLAAAASCGKQEERKELAERARYIEHLHEKYADYKELEYGLDITKKTDIVSICYSTWFTKILGEKTKDPNPPNIRRFWQETGSGADCMNSIIGRSPALGYYKSDDKDVIPVPI